jgi:hypothetical protein
MSASSVARIHFKAPCQFNHFFLLSAEGRLLNFLYSFLLVVLARGLFIFLFPAEGRLFTNISNLIKSNF